MTIKSMKQKFLKLQDRILSSDFRSKTYENDRNWVGDWLWIIENINEKTVIGAFNAGPIKHANDLWEKYK